MDEHRWWKEIVVYQIYPKSFCDSNGDGVGDLQGIIEKLDYLMWLGVGALWLSPIYPSPECDNGYDVSDYDAVDPHYGTMMDFDRLIREAHARNIKVIIDLVVNHTSEAHKWFRESCISKHSPKRDYYIWRDGKADGSPPNNWGALFGGAAWTRPEGGDQYCLNLFSPQQPDLNWSNPSLRKEIYAMMRRWLDRGVDGFRLDVISLIAKPEDISDGPVGPSGYFDPRRRIAANPQVHRYLREMRDRVLRGRDIVTVGEASAATLGDARLFSNPDGSELDMVFQFEHMDLDGGESFKWTERTIPLDGLKRVMAKWQHGLEGSGWNALFWSNHDQPRMLSRMGDEGELRETSAKMLATCLHMMKGTPFIYQGEELGMTNMRFSRPDQLRDTESINAYFKYTQNGEFSKSDMMRLISLKSRDNARTPMQWSATPGAGFTKSAPWMDINPNYTYINVAEQRSRSDSVLAYYRELIRLRQAYEVVAYGEFIPFAQDDPCVFAYVRKLPGQRLFVCCNYTKKTLRFMPPEEFVGTRARMLLTNVENSEYVTLHLLAAYEAVVLLANEEV
ncbi:Oligo-1,6-glucosidase [bioreactor metagenome]|uniref:Oligo-1,6-glucosidase n=1 Tax=bioreactor metagenome TaxID=1076179 RepID=A0A644Y016_9ZZZZ